MPFEEVLHELLEQSPGAVGAMFMDDTGETVGLVSEDLPRFDLLVTGARLEIELRRLAALTADARLGKARLVHIERRGLHVHLAALPEGYFLALLQRPPALVAPARARLRRAADRLAAELFP